MVEDGLSGIIEEEAAGRDNIEQFIDYCPKPRAQSFIKKVLILSAVSGCIRSKSVRCWTVVLANVFPSPLMTQ